MKDNLKILFVIGQLDQGGAERQLFLLLSELSEPATVLSLSKGGYWASQIQQFGHEVIELERNGHLELGRLATTVKIFREKKPDVIHLFSDGIEGLYARIAGLFINHPHLIIGVRIIPSFYPLWYQYLLRYLNRAVSVVVCNSHKSVDYIKENHLAPQNKIQYIPNSIDSKLFCSFKKEHPPANKEKLKRNLIVGTVASLTYKKNPLLFIQAAFKIHQVKPNVKFWIIGDGCLWTKCESLINELGLQEVVELLGIQKKIFELLAELDMFVLSSRFEGTSNAFLEAMAAKLPCVVTDVGDSGRIAVESGAGIVVPSEDLEGIVQAILKLLDDSKLRLKMGQAGYSYVCQSHTKAEVAERYLTLYKSIANQSAVV